MGDILENLLPFRLCQCEDVPLNRQHWKVTAGFFKGMKGLAIEGITNSLYQRHYKTWSLYIFCLFYIYHKGYDCAEWGDVK